MAWLRIDRYYSAKEKIEIKDGIETEFILIFNQPNEVK
jgi:hypothetical protein